MLCGYNITGDNMIFLFDILLLIPLLFLIFINRASNSEKLLIQFLSVCAPISFIIRRFSFSHVAIICVVITFFSCVVIKKLCTYFCKNEYVVVSVDSKNKTCYLTDGKSIKAITCENAEKYNIGEIIRITTKFN